MNKPQIDKEVVLLMDADSWRPVVIDLQQHVGTIVERVRGPLNQVMEERVWIWQDGERAATGQRIFRELLKPSPPEPSEKPLFDELVIKKPLPFTWQS